MPVNSRDGRCQNDKMDLAQVEGLGDLLSAETEAQRRQAMRSASGAAGGHAPKWRKALLTALARLWR
jgi:tRNA modification GTPase